ncbi:autotransporter domain-containing protein, partial [Bradyrhizobium sp. Ce-3]|uniref:autotransporter domain-containing protein n=1 Tax=Bradyrhizobium sp. Ce-3 TaxID=2913970 RepID=UPI001FC883D1
NDPGAAASAATTTSATADDRSGIVGDGGGGGGGGGGAGIVVTKAGGITITNAGFIQGGGGGSNAAFGGNVVGGGGGAGIDASLATAPVTVVNTGAIVGGNQNVLSTGGQGQGSAAGGGAGNGAGVVGQNLTVINAGTISGGLAGDGVTRANVVSFTGGVNVLELQAGSVLTGNAVAFSTADTLRLGGSSNATFDVSQIGAQYLGFGQFAKSGGSTWTLTGSNAAAMPWTINAGTLNVTGTIANAGMTVNGGTLAGTGTIGTTQVNAGGSFAPGNGTPGSSMTIAGNLALQSGAAYMVQINPTTASFASVAGTATFGGATVSATYANGSYVEKQYTIVTANGGVSGSFAPVVVNTNLPSSFAASLSYDANHAYLNLVLSFSGAGLSQNQQAVGGALANFFNRTGGIPLVYASLTPAGLSQAAGELGAGSQQTTFNAMGQFLGLLTDPFTPRNGASSGSPGAAGYADEALGYAATAHRDAYAMFTKAPPVPFVPRWNVWAAGFGGSQATDGNAATGSNDTRSSIAGTAVGADYLFSPNTIAGFALAGGGTNFSVNGMGYGRSDLFQAGAYIRHSNGAAYVTGALAYGWQDITTNRFVTAAGFDQLRAQFNANAYSGRIEGGYRFVAPVIGGLGIAPYVAGQFTTFDLPAYAETVVSGTPNFALAYAAKSVTDTRSELGIRTDQSFAMSTGILTLRGRVAWAHDFNPDRAIATTFQALPGASFVVNGAAQASESALTTASAEWKWINGWSAAATFEGEFSNVTRSYAGKGVVRYAW